MLLETFRTLNNFKRKANKRKFAYMLKSTCSVTWYPWQQYNRSNLVSNSENRVCRSHEKFLLWTNSVEIKHTFFIHPAFLVHWNLHPWWRVILIFSCRIPLNMTFGGSFSPFALAWFWLFIKSEGSYKSVCVVRLSFQVSTFRFCFYVYHQMHDFFTLFTLTKRVCMPIV